jgi:heterodisulfide reductase subunit C
MLRDGWIASIPGRCVQCGICSYSCPMGIDVRSYSRRGLPIDDPRCFRCGSCVSHCPRSTLVAVVVGSAA